MKILSKNILKIIAVSVFCILTIIPSYTRAGFSFDDVLDTGGVIFAIPTGGLSLIPGALNDGDILGVDLLGGQTGAGQQTSADAAKGQECMRKTLTELEEQYEESTGKPFAYNGGARSDGLSEQARKEQICIQLINEEGDEEDTSYSESFLWKPKSDSDGKAVTLLPTSLTGTVITTEILDAGNIKMERGRYTGNANGHRDHYRFTKPGSSYGSGIQVVAVVAEGAWIWKIPNGGQRFESGKGRFVTNAEMAAWEALHAAKQTPPTIPTFTPTISSCPIGQTDTNRDKSLKIMAMGDSNTSGTASSQDLAYRKILKERLVSKGYTVDMVGSQSSGTAISDNQHEGYPGEGIGKLQAVANGNILTTHNPDIILLLVGSNDMWVSLDNRTPISDSAANTKIAELGTLLDTIHRKLPDAKIIVGKPATPDKGGTAATRPLGIYKTGIDTLARTRSYVSVVDFTGFGNDGTHYDASGYNAIAEIFSSKVDSITRVCTGTTTAATSTSATSTAPITSTELDVICKVSDTTPGIDEDVDIWLEVSGGTKPYEGDWSGDYKKADNFDKDSADQTVSFEKKGNYKIKVTVTDKLGEKAKDNCPTIKVTADGEDDNVIVRSENTNQANSGVTSNTNYPFYRDLDIGAQGDDVIALQNILIAQGFLTMPTGVAKGYFGNLTKTSLARWQAAKGITPALGYFGAKSRAYLTSGTVGVTASQAQTSPAQTWTPVTTTISTSNSNSNSDSCVNIVGPIYYEEENLNVTKVQQFLVAKGHLTMPAGVTYGFYGRSTVTALSKFMTSRGFTHNGAIMDAKVLGEIKLASCQ